VYPAIWQKSISSLKFLWYIKEATTDHVESANLSQRRRKHEG